MAYSTSNPPALIAQRIGGGGQIWDYASTDAGSAVDGANYFTNGGSLGLAAGGTVVVHDTDASPVATTLHTINAVGDGTTDLSDGTALSTTDTD